ncbi:MAG: bifunctional riboflavin kinase/FAD synthetase [Lachnospiraceae bacterium]|nr:bifunctional riboflavin kinase/FAD synthetase [Lachnospiraceae bacterium]
MEIIKDTFDFSVEGRTVITLGKFDGVHRGHQALICRARDYAASGQMNGQALYTVLFSFMIGNFMLLTVPERRELVERMGVDILVECPFVPQIITMEAEAFVKDVLVGQMHARHLVVGDDYRFGYGRRGDVSLLRKMGEEYGFSVETVPKVKDGDSRVSSSRIREALDRGDMETVNRLLGYDYFVEGPVIHGRRIGRRIGFPTTNLIPDGSKRLPPNGVYFVRTEIGDRVYNGVTNIGTKPTVDGHFLGVETYLYDCEEGADLYGQKQKVELLHFSRPEMKFSTVEELREQISVDRKAGLHFFEKHSF